MLSRGKSSGQVARVRDILVGLFFTSIIQVAGAPLFSYYWLRDNNGPLLTPDADYRVQWIPDDEFRGLDAEKGPTYAAPGGRKTYAAGATWQMLRPYNVTTPDGKWHLEVLARGPMNPYALRAFGLAAVPSVIFSVLGLVVCLHGLKADSSSKGEKHDPAFQDLS